VKWTVPDGWREGKNTDALRYATFVLGPPDKEVELVVTPLGKEAISELFRNETDVRQLLGTLSRQEECALQIRGAMDPVSDLNAGDLAIEELVEHPAEQRPIAR
jgi:hypothetical protein